VLVEPFIIEVPDDVLDDLRRRIRSTRWPDAAPGNAWSQGVDRAFLQNLLTYWADGFDWRAQEERLNRYDHCIADIDGIRLHFVSHRGYGERLHAATSSGGADRARVMNEASSGMSADVIPTRATSGVPSRSPLRSPETGATGSPIPQVSRLARRSRAAAAWPPPRLAASRANSGSR
jgi:Epoxide hydrolase N terminus